LISLLASLPSFHAKAIVARVTVWHKAGSAKLALVEKLFCQRKRFSARLANAGGCGIMGLHEKFTFLLPRPRVLEHRWDNYFPAVIIPQMAGK
jgi:hypothetical protein